MPITVLSEGERQALLAEVDVADALFQLAELQSKWDSATAKNLSVEPLHLELLRCATSDWVPAVKAAIRRGRVFAVPQVTVQLTRELLEAKPSGATRLAAETLVQLLISIATEQQLHAEFASGVPTSAEMGALDARLQTMSREELATFSHDFLHDLAANMLFSMPRRIESLKADAFDFWFSPWAERVDESLGVNPAAAFADATGMDLDLLLLVGVAIDKTIVAGQTILRLEDHTDDEKVCTFIRENMSLDLSQYREQLEADRAAGDIKLQRYSFTRFPFLDLGQGNLLILRPVWAIERFFGDPVQFDVEAAFTAKGAKTKAKRFGEAVKYQFEELVGRTLDRIATRSVRIDAVKREPELEAQWTEKKGHRPSVCDWLLQAGHVMLLVDATHHPLNAKLAQGLGSGETYDADANRVLTAGKFMQFASVMRLVRRLGISGQPQPEAIFLPFVVVPNSGTPSSMFTELDYAFRAEQVFAEFQGRVARPAVLQLQELQLLEAIGDHASSDVVSFIYSWRRYPVPLSLQEFMDVKGVSRPISKHIHRAASELDRRLARKNRGAR